MSKISFPARLWARIDIMLDWKLGPLGFGYALSFPVVGVSSRLLFGSSGVLLALMLLSLLPVTVFTVQLALRPKTDLASPAWLEAAIWITKPACRADLITGMEAELTKDRPLTQATVISLMHNVEQRYKAEAFKRQTDAALPEQQLWLKSLLERLKG